MAIKNHIGPHLFHRTFRFVMIFHMTDKIDRRSRAADCDAGVLQK